MITVAKPGLMITHLGREQKVFALSGFEFKINPNIPARNFLPESESSIPLVGHDLNNNLKL
jgi:hypothetical protein